MRKKLLLWAIILFIPFLAVAQTFTTLHWEGKQQHAWGTEHVDVLSFEGAMFEGTILLPRYTTSFALPINYTQYTYRVSVDYPEYRKITKEELSLIKEWKENLSDHPVIETQLSVSSKKGVLDATLLPIVVRNGNIYLLTSFMLTLHQDPIKLKSVAATTRHTYATTSRLATGRWVKIKTGASGVYKLTTKELQKMGFSDPNKVRLFGFGGAMLHESFAKPKSDDLPEVPLWKVADGFLFYANGTIRWELTGSYFTHAQNPYSTYGAYFLSDNEDLITSFETEQSVDPAKATLLVTTYNEYQVYEKETYSFSASGRKLFDVPIGTSSTKYTFNTTGITNDLGRVVVEFASNSGSNGNTLEFSIDGKETFPAIKIPALTEQYAFGTSGKLDVAWQKEKSDQTVVSILNNRKSGEGRLDYIRLNYIRKLQLYGSYTLFRALATKGTTATFVLSNATDQTQVWDITTIGAYKKIAGTLQGSEFQFTLASSEVREFVAFNPQGVFDQQVESMGVVENQDLHQLKEVDMIIITPPNAAFVSQANRLAAVHAEKEGLRSVVVTSDQVYNEFSSGTPDATAYRWLMKMLYDRAAVGKEPKYLLLFGDCAWDNRLLTAGWKRYNQSELLLSYQSESSLKTTSDASYVTDDYFGFLDDNEGVTISADKLDIGIGRFPVQTAKAAQEMVDKTIAYMANTNGDSWKNRLCFVADDGDDNANVHMTQTEYLTQYVARNSPEYMINRVFIDAFPKETTASGKTSPAATSRLLELINKGSFLLNYTGHGSVHSWAVEALLVKEQVMALTNKKQGFWITSTCDFGMFDGINNSAGEELFLNPRGGAIATITTSRVVYGGANSALNVQLNKHLFSKPNGKRLSIGEINRLGKNETNGSNKLSFVLLGDPALKLTYPEYNLVVDSVNGVAVQTATQMLKAGSVATIQGHVSTPSGEASTDFSGLVHATVFDQKEHIVTNGVYGTTFEYDEYTKLLFAGSDSLKNGRFNIQFPIPIDINYSNKPGLINLYAVDQTGTREAKNSFTDFLVGGSIASLNSDTIGPKIALYLNTPSFKNGDKTHETPLLVVVLEDQSGINSSGASIGHDLMVSIDQSNKYTYNLNNNYQSEPGVFTNGIIRFSIPTLPEGKHTLLFRAWDTLNNSSTQQLDFEVVKGLKPTLFDVTSSSNPVKERTTFVISHDRIDAPIDITLSVYDLTGTKLWSAQNSSLSSDGFSYLDWNLVTSSGQALTSGIYLYQATISSQGGAESTKTKRMMVIGQ